jgi:branched-chain amino acid transport system ATP-binding protein
LLKVDQVSAGYGKLQILSDVSVVAEPTEVTVVVGPNGSGKSTLLKTIAGLTSIYSGTVEFDGKKISGMKPHEIARDGLAYLPQTEAVFTQLKVSENLKMAGYTIDENQFEQRVKETLLIFPKVSEFMEKKVVQLSGGERQMVAMMMALIRKPKVVMFDEPTANLAPKIATQVLDTIKSLAKAMGITVVLVEQNAKRALEMGDRAYLLVGGKRAFEGTSKELLGHQELAKMYLGLKVGQNA